MRAQRLLGLFGLGLDFSQKSNPKFCISNTLGIKYEGGGYPP